MITDIDGTTIAALSAGTVTLGVIITYLMQMVKGWFPSLEGRRAEVAVVGVSLVAVLLAMWGADTDWRDDKTYLAVIVGTLAATKIARDHYAQQWKQSVPNLPVEQGERIVAVETAPDDQPAFGWRRE